MKHLIKHLDEVSRRCSQPDPVSRFSAWRSASVTWVRNLVLGIAIVFAAAPTVEAAIASRGTATAVGNTTLLINKPSGVVSGDVLFADLSSVGNATANATSSGWTLVAGADLAGPRAGRGTLLYKVAGASEPANYTFTFGSGTSNTAGGIVAFSGVNVTGETLFDVTPGAISVQASSATATSITTISPNAAVVMFGMAPNGTTTWSGWSTTSPGALTELFDIQGTNSSSGAAWALKATAGATGNGSATLADSYATPPVIPLAKWNSFRSPGFDNTGSYYGFISQMANSVPAGVSSTNNVGVFVDTAPGVLTLQLRENAAAPGTTAGVVFSDFSDLVLGGVDYEFLVKGEVRGTGVVTNVNDKGLWAQHATNGLVLVAREGSEAPGVSGSSFSKLNQIALPGTAQPMFQATMAAGVGGVTTASDTGLWVVNASNNVVLAVREGTVLNVGGTNRTVTGITALLNGTTTGGAVGRRVFLADGQLTLLLTFSGGVQANAKVVVP